MKGYKLLAVFALFFLAACSGGVETVKIPDASGAPLKDTALSTDTTLPTHTVPAADTTLPTDAVPPTNATLPTETTSPPETAIPAPERELEIITLLPKDGIPAIDNPVFISVDEADSQYEPDELVIGVQFDGDARAYSIPLLSSHEIVNDTVGGRKIAVTW